MAVKKRVTKKKATTVAKIKKKVVKKVAKKVVAASKNKVVKAKVKAVKAVAKKVKVKAKVNKVAIAKKPVVKAKLEKVTQPYTKSELYRVLAERSALTKGQISKIIEELVNVIKLHLQKDGPEKFTLPGMLKMVVKKVPAKKARKGVNPFTGEQTMFKAKPASRKVKIAALKALKDLA